MTCSTCSTASRRRSAAAPRSTQIVQQLLETAHCGRVILKAVVERPILQSLGKANLQRVTGPGVIRQPQVAADDMLQQPGGGLLGQRVHHGRQSRGCLEETVRGGADVLQPELV